MIHYGGRGAVVVGEIDRRVTVRTTAIRDAWRDFDERAIATANIFGYLWSKEAYGAMLFATALTNESIADALAMPEHRDLYIALAREILAVAAAREVTLEAFDGFDPTAYLPHAPGCRGGTVAGRSCRVQPSFRQDAQRNMARPRGAEATHGGRCPVGHRRDAGEQAGVPTPLTACLVEPDPRHRERVRARSRCSCWTRWRQRGLPRPCTSSLAAGPRSSRARRTVLAARSASRSHSEERASGRATSSRTNSSRRNGCATQRDVDVSAASWT